MVTDAPLMSGKEPALPPGRSSPPLLIRGAVLLLFCFLQGKKPFEVNGQAGVLHFRPDKISDLPRRPSTNWTCEVLMEETGGLCVNYIFIEL